MKKQFLLINTALLLSLVACSSSPTPEPTDNALLKLYDANAKFVSNGYGKDITGADEWFPLATYRHKNNGEAPYVELGQFLNALNNMFHVDINYTTMASVRVKQYDSYVEKVSDHLYGIYSEQVLGALIDTKENVLNIKRFDYMFAQQSTFNATLRGDVASPNNSPESMLQGSNQSRYIGEFKDEVYDLDDYNMDIIELDDKVYMPEPLLSNIFFRGLGGDVAYNGNDFFMTNTVGVESMFTNLVGSFRSTKNTFETGKVIYSLADPVGQEECRYVGKVVKDEQTSYTIYSLDKNGGGCIFNASSPTSTDMSDPTHKLAWERKEDGDIYITIFNKNQASGTGFAAHGSVMRISSKETFYNQKARSQALADFNYQLLRFQIDNLYGLKDELHAKHGFNDFDSFVKEKGLKEKLLSIDTRTYDEGLSEFLMKYIDDGHTRYTDRSVFTGQEEVTTDDLVIRYMGPRRQNLINRREEYQADRENALGEGVDPIGVFMEDETAVIRFDSFTHILPIISNPGHATDSMPTSMLLTASSPFGFMRCFDEISKNSKIKNVVMDLTCNGGGMVLTLPFLASYFTKDPIIYLRDNLAGVVREFHYSVDLNGDGIHGGEGDYLGDKYHMYVLTSDFSFSCGSALPTLAHIAGVDVIGLRCAGGACNVSGFSDACGSIYTLSAPQQIGYLDENGNFVNDDAGIPVTHELAEEYWYDMVKLNQAVKGFSNN